jgi:hypothetical protein
MRCHVTATPAAFLSRSEAEAAAAAAAGVEGVAAISRLLGAVSKHGAPRPLPHPPATTTRRRWLIGRDSPTFAAGIVTVAMLWLTTKGDARSLARTGRTPYEEHRMEGRTAVAALLQTVPARLHAAASQRLCWAKAQVRERWPSQPFLRVHWVAVPEAVRARRVNSIGGSVATARALRCCRPTWPRRLRCTCLSWPRGRADRHQTGRARQQP